MRGFVISFGTGGDGRRRRACASARKRGCARGEGGSGMSWGVAWSPSQYILRRVRGFAPRQRGWRSLPMLAGAIAGAAVIGTGVAALWIASLGPAPLGERLEFSTAVVDRDGRLLRPYATSDGRWRLPARFSFWFKISCPANGPTTCRPPGGTERMGSGRSRRRGKSPATLGNRPRRFRYSRPER